MSIRTIDCDYTGRPGIAAAYLMREGDEAAFIETNTTHAVPRLLAALAEEGLAPEDVRYVIITHVHLDHAGGAGALMAACPNATLLAHPRAAPHAIDPQRIVAGATEVYGAERFASLYGEVVPVDAARVRTLDDEEELVFGGRTLRFLHTRGHANHHFCVQDSATNGIFTGDSFGILYPDLQRKGPYAFPSTTPTDFDPEAAHETLDRIVAAGPERVWPTHFGEHTRVQAIADQLRTHLDVFQRFYDQADASGIDGQELDDFCDTWVRSHMEASLDAKGLGTVADRRLIALDAELNSQGLAFAVRKARHKRKRVR